MTKPSSLRPETATAPRYVSYGGEQVFQQPYAARGTRLYSFVLPIHADNRALPQHFLDRVFNHPSGGAVDFRVALPFVMLSFQRFQDLGANTPPDSAKGGFAYNEATLWLPVTDKKSPGPDLAFFVPYIFADNHFAIAAGREVYGYPKALGQITMPQSHGDPVEFRLDTEIIEHFSPSALGKQAALIEVRPGATPHHPESIWQKWEHAAEHIIEHMADDAINFFVHDVTHPKVEMVFLKQFRDVATGENACYQAIIGAAGAIYDFQGGAPMGDDFEVTIHPCDSHPICADLGLESSYTTHGFYLEFSFDILPGRELWKAS